MTGGPVTLLTACRSLEELMLNLNCNAISGVQITHHFLRKLVRRGA